MKRLLIPLLLLPLLGAGGVWYWRTNGKSQQAFRTAKVERGDLVATINATGTIQPENVYDVGARVPGQIKGFGIDPRDSSKLIDYRSEVEEGTVLAWIDDSLYQAQVNQAKANLERAEADLGQLRARARQAERDRDRLRGLRNRDLVSEAELDLADTTYVSAEAAVKVGQAAISQAKAALNEAEINLGFCTIRSPVKGVIIDRRVNIGQTVVASLNAPSLFLIAKDLKRLQVWASVNEADIGHIQDRQQVTFTVDKRPGMLFHGEVVQTRYNASISQNVVSYTVVVNTDNSSGILLPYLTATLRFTIGQRSNVLSVPNTALRFRPSSEYVAAEFREDYIEAGRRRGGELPSPSDDEHAGEGTIWVAEDGFLEPVQVQVGLSDGVRTEVQGEGVTAATDVVIGIAQASADDDAQSPFTPQTFRKRQE
jgi:HlyD family secretion protein